LQEVIAFGFPGYLNTQGGLARGAEASANIALTRSTNLLASYTYTKAQDRTPLVENVTRTLIIPDHQVSLSATQRIGRRFTAVFQVLATSNYLAPLTNFTTFANFPFQFPGKRLAELGGSYRIPLGDYRALRFFAKASNIFDPNYYESGYRTPGATGTGGLQFEF
jgi:outer membrane receptor protein involved in Fe transport